MAAIWGAAIGAGAGLLGDFMSSHGQQQTNAMNLQMQQQMEGWQEKMSNTAMQRRVADLKAAGLNPMLAVGQGGASTPGIAPVNIQNPEAAYGNLGGQTAQAIAAGQAIAQTENTKADTALKQANLPPSFLILKDDGTPDFIRSGGGTLGALTAEKSYKDIQVADATVQNIKQATETGKTQQVINQIQQQIQGMNRDFQSLTYQWALQEAANDLRISNTTTSRAEAEAKILGDKTWGPIITVLKTVLGLGTAGVSLLNKAQYPTTGR